MLSSFRDRFYQLSLLDKGIESQQPQVSAERGRELLDEMKKQRRQHENRRNYRGGYKNDER